LNTPLYEPRMARVAAAIGDPTRARTLARLLDGRLYTASELAEYADVTRATMSSHLKLLVDEGLAKLRAQGRYRYFGLADGNVAHALEALLMVADGVSPDMSRWKRPSMRSLKHARSCYGHLAGELGVQLHDVLLQRGWVQSLGVSEDVYLLTPSGLAGFASLGLDVSELRAANNTRQSRPLYSCIDWSERRDHFAGTVATAILDTLIAQQWLRREADSRKLSVTSQGRNALLNLFPLAVNPKNN
jgi:DNA-binding transcriptional ArsR family regulator